MTYLDNGATSFHKPETVWRAMGCALENCANPGRGGYTAAMAAAKTVLRCRERAGELFHRQLHPRAEHRHQHLGKTGGAGGDLRL